MLENCTIITLNTKFEIAKLDLIPGLSQRYQTHRVEVVRSLSKFDLK